MKQEFGRILLEKTNHGHIPCSLHLGVVSRREWLPNEDALQQLKLILGTKVIILRET